MSAVPIVEVPSYDHLVLLDRSIEYDRPSLMTFLFRGHACADWRLVPSRLRQVTVCGLSASEARAVERSARLEFHETKQRFGLELPEEPTMDPGVHRRVRRPPALAVFSQAGVTLSPRQRCARRDRRLFPEHFHLGHPP